jgi:YYY domain-containing protein
MDFQLRELYFQANAQEPYEPEPISFDQPVGELPVVDDARWSAELTGDSWAALVVWILLLIVLQAAAWPLVRRVFARFPDRGWAFGRLVSLSISAWVVWYLASLELIAFRAIWSWIALALVGALAWIAIPIMSSRIGRRGDVDARDGVSPRNGYIVAAEAVFWVVFLLFLSYRWVNPDSYHPLWGGEKPMEFAHINAILRSAHFPPVDPWYADGYLNYYYYGAYLVAFMFKLTGIPSEIAFNLAQPTFAAFLATGAFSVGAALSGRASRSRAIGIGGGLLATVLMSVSGNLIVAARLLNGLRTPSPPLDSFRYWFWDPTRAPAVEPLFVITEFPYFSATYADLHAHVIALPITVLIVGLVFALAIDARQLAVATAAPQRSIGATAAVVTRSALLALALGTLFMTNAWDVPTFGAMAVVGMLTATRAFSGVGWRLVATIGLTVVVAIAAYLVALPFTLSYVTLVSEIAETRDQSLFLAVESHFGVFLLIVPFGLCALLYRRVRSVSPFSDPVMWAALLGTCLLLRWYAVGRSATLVHWADNATAAAVVAMVLLACWRTFPSRADFRLPQSIMRFGVILAWTVTVWALAVERPALALFAGLAIAAGMLWLSLRGTAERIIAAMIAGAFFIAAGTELIYLVDDLSGGPAYKMNTIFKFYNGVWSLLALACAGLLAFLFALIRGPSPVATDTTPAIENGAAFRLGSHWSTVGTVIGTAAILATLAFPVFSTSARLSQHFDQPGGHRTLNALDWMSYGTITTGVPTSEHFEAAEDDGIELSNPVTLTYAEDRAVIDWFNAEVPGTPVIAEASIDPYRCGGSRISIHTGLPVVIGWVRHEMQQRYQTHLVERREDLRTLYMTEDPEEKQRIIDRYRIEYIVVGDLEQHYPTNDCRATENGGGIEAFLPLVGSELEVAFTAGETVVYHVI